LTAIRPRGDTFSATSKPARERPFSKTMQSSQTSRCSMVRWYCWALPRINQTQKNSVLLATASRAWSIGWPPTTIISHPKKSPGLTWIMPRKKVENSIIIVIPTYLSGQRQVSHRLCAETPGEQLPKYYLYGNGRLGVSGQK